MKINVFIQLLDEKNRLQKSERKSFDEKLDRALSRLSDGDTEPDLDYKLSLSNQSQKNPRAQEVLDQNSDFRDPLRSEGRALKPVALSSVSDFSIRKIEQALASAESSQEALRDSHSTPDRGRVAKVLL